MANPPPSPHCSPHKRPTRKSRVANKAKWCAIRRCQWLRLIPGIDKPGDRRILSDESLPSLSPLCPLTGNTQEESSKKKIFFFFPGPNFPMANRHWHCSRERNNSYKIISEHGQQILFPIIWVWTMSAPRTKKTSQKNCPTTKMLKGED